MHEVTPTIFDGFQLTGWARRVIQETAKRQNLSRRAAIEQDGEKLLELTRKISELVDKRVNRLKSRDGGSSAA